MVAAADDAVRASFGRAMTKPNFIERFYDIFTKSHPQIPVLFKNTDMTHQRELLSQSLSMVLLFPMGNPIAKNVINRIRTSHSRYHLNISPELYFFWEDSLISALAECDPEFDSILERQWREVLEVAIEYIKAGY